jgi:hypothetical protein
MRKLIAAPGDRMKDQSSTLSGTKGPGASSYAPGHEQKTPGGASEMSPGDKMNDARSHGSPLLNNSCTLIAVVVPPA